MPCMCGDSECPSCGDAQDKRRRPGYQKPLPNESIYKHLQMLYNYCIEQGDADVHPSRSDAFKRVAKGLAKIADGAAVRMLQDFGE